MRISILFDNFLNEPDGGLGGLQAGWGFSALLETKGRTVLFDTGADGEILLENMRILGKDPKTIQAVVISHAHWDHTGGLQSLLQMGLSAPLFALDAFPEEFGELADGAREVRNSTPGEVVVPGIRTTGLLGDDIPEQGLILDTATGSVVVTGCAHPGIVSMTRRSRGMVPGPLHAVLGGFHLKSASQEEIRGVMLELRELGVERAGPTHCSGDPAMALFREEFGEDYLHLGVGAVLSFPARA